MKYQPKVAVSLDDAIQEIWKLCSSPTVSGEYEVHFKIDHLTLPGERRAFLHDAQYYILITLNEKLRELAKNSHAKLRHNLICIAQPCSDLNHYRVVDKVHISIT